MSVLGHGVELCTYATRPSNPPVGTIIYQTDTNEYLKYVDNPDLSGNKLWMQVESKSNRNKIINGNMTIDQRNNGSTVQSNGSFPVDRFRYNTPASSWTVQLSRNLLSSPVTGAINTYALRAFVSGSGTPSGATDEVIIQQRIEGLNLLDAGFGLFETKYMTLSFWVNASTGGPTNNLYSVSFRNSATNRSYVATYTINNAFSWEYKTITIPVDLSGTWLRDNNVGLSVAWNLGAGSSRLTTAGSWQTGNFIGTSGTRNLIQTNGAEFFLSNVQLELGTAASDFEVESYNTQLDKCLRYFMSYGGTAAYERVGFGSAISATNVLVYTPFPVPMRAAPSAVASSGNFNISDGATGYIATGVTLNTNHSAPTSGWSNWTVASGLTQYRPYSIETNNSTTARFSFSAELA